MCLSFSFLTLDIGRRFLFLLLHPLDLYRDFLLSTIKTPFPIAFAIKYRGADSFYLKERLDLLDR